MTYVSRQEIDLLMDLGPKLTLKEVVPKELDRKPSLPASNPVVGNDYNGNNTEKYTDTISYHFFSFYRSSCCWRLFI